MREAENRAIITPVVVRVFDLIRISIIVSPVTLMQACTMLRALRALKIAVATPYSERSYSNLRSSFNIKIICRGIRIRFGNFIQYNIFLITK